MIVPLLVGQLLLTPPAGEITPHAQTEFFASFSSKGTSLWGTYVRFPQFTPGLQLGLGLLNFQGKGHVSTLSTLQLSYTRKMGPSTFHFQLYYTFPLHQSLTKFWNPFLAR